MGMKIMVDIQGNLYDMWEVRSIEKGKRFNEDANDGDGGMEYTIVLNKRSIALNFSEVEFAYSSEEERDDAFQEIKKRLSEYETVVIV